MFIYFSSNKYFVHDFLTTKDCIFFHNTRGLMNSWLLWKSRHCFKVRIEVVGRISQAWLSIFVSWLESVKFVKTDGPQHLICWNNILKFLIGISCKKEKHLSSQKCCVLLMETKITLKTMGGADKSAFFLFFFIM